MALERGPMVVEDLGDRTEIAVPYRPGLAAGCAGILVMVYVAIGVVAIIVILATAVFSSGPPAPGALEALGPLVFTVVVWSCIVVHYSMGREQITVSSHCLTIRVRPFGLRRRYPAARVRDLRVVRVPTYQRWLSGGERTGWIAFGRGLGTRRFGRYADHDEARRIVRLIHRRFKMAQDEGEEEGEDGDGGSLDP